MISRFFIRNMDARKQTAVRTMTYAAPIATSVVSMF